MCTGNFIRNAIGHVGVLQADGKSAYLQALLSGAEDSEIFAAYLPPACTFYGHPRAGSDWAAHLRSQLLKHGWQPIANFCFLRLECGGPCAGCSYTLLFARSASSRSASSTPESKAAAHARGKTAGNRRSSANQKGLWFFFFFRAPFRLSSAVPVHEYNGLRAGSGQDAGRRLASRGPLPPAARTSWRSGTTPASQSSPPGGSSSNDAAKARMAATARMPDQRWTHPAHAAARSGGGRLAARCRARWRRKEAASDPKRPPTSTPMTTRRARRALASSG